MLQAKFREHRLRDNLSPEGYILSHGLKFPFDTDVLSSRQIRHLRQETYEQKETNAVTRIVGPEDSVLELGAGMGYMSTLCYKNCKAKKVVTVEANPLMVPYIEKVHAANDAKDIEVINALMGPKDARAKTFYIRDQFVASSLIKEAAGVNAKVIDTAKVPVKSIHDVVKRVKPTILVCDIEGAEEALIPVMDLKGLRAAVVELHPQWIGSKGTKKIFDAMSKAGLTYFPKLSQGKVVTFRRDF